MNLLELLVSVGVLLGPLAACTDEPRPALAVAVAGVRVAGPAVEPLSVGPGTFKGQFFNDRYNFIPFGITGGVQISYYR